MVITGLTFAGGGGGLNQGPASDNVAGGAGGAGGGGQGFGNQFPNYSNNQAGAGCCWNCKHRRRWQVVEETQVATARR